MRISADQRQQNEARIRAAIDRLLGGDIPPGGKCDIKTLAREAAVDRAAFYGTRPYAHLRKEFETRLLASQQAGDIPDRRDAQIARLKDENATLRQRLADHDTTITDPPQLQGPRTRPARHPARRDHPPPHPEQARRHGPPPADPPRKQGHPPEPHRPHPCHVIPVTPNPPNRHTRTATRVTNACHDRARPIATRITANTEIAKTRHTTLTWVERHFGFATAQAYAGHEDHGRGGKAMATYVRAGLPR